MSIDAYIGREGIKQVVTLLGAAPDNPYVNVEIIPTAVSGEQEDPVSVYRAALMCTELATRDEIDDGARQGLFDIAYSFEDSDDGKVIAVTPIEENDVDADRQTAREIVADLNQRFDLDRYAKLGLTSDQVAELVRPALAVCAAGEEGGEQLAWALDFFTDPDGIVKLGEAIWHKLDNKYGPL
ncbi:hypothetical protein ABZ815_20575 [Nonomuraea sp. NPDC047529]|uniref:hypothetical protein n=1 Tax=Nonomuraea sp. NPDC047529 TaxID=3155623 RepID=UPI0033C9F850